MFLRSLPTLGCAIVMPISVITLMKAFSYSVMLKLLCIDAMDGNLTSTKDIKNAMLEVSGRYGGQKWPYPKLKHYTNSNSLENAIREAVKETHRAAKSLFLVAPLLGHHKGVFDTTSGQLTLATVMPLMIEGEPQSTQGYRITALPRSARRSQ